MKKERKAYNCYFISAILSVFSAVITFIWGKYKAIAGMWLCIGLLDFCLGYKALKLSKENNDIENKEEKPD